MAAIELEAQGQQGDVGALVEKLRAEVAEAEERVAQAKLDVLVADNDVLIDLSQAEVVRAEESMRVEKELRKSKA